jgi:hypothetical protein
LGAVVVEAKGSRARAEARRCCARAVDSEARKERPPRGRALSLAARLRDEL